MTRLEKLNGLKKRLDKTLGGQTLKELYELFKKDEPTPFTLSQICDAEKLQEEIEKLKKELGFVSSFSELRPTDKQWGKYRDAVDKYADNTLTEDEFYSEIF